jgi:UDPglucose 6-dehydrogenase
VSSVNDHQPIGVIGVGWVGLVTASCFAELGHPIHAVDIDAAKIDALGAGEVPIHEPGLAEQVQRNRERLHFTTEISEVLANARLLFCCVDTPRPTPATPTSRESRRSSLRSPRRASTRW